MREIVCFYDFNIWRVQDQMFNIGILLYHGNTILLHLQKIKLYQVFHFLVVWQVLLIQVQGVLHKGDKSMEF